MSDPLNPPPGTTMPRPTAAQRGYGTAWIKAKAGHLRSHPWCALCAVHGKQTPATTVHHTVRHNGDQAVFWDKSKWQSVCQPHHDGPCQRDEKREERGLARIQAIGPDGWPL